MGQDVEELKTDIERSRADLGDTIDAIGDRISPGRMVTRQRNRMSDGVSSVRDRVMGTISNTSDKVSDSASNAADHVGPDAVRRQTQGSPLGAGFVAFGIGLVAAAVFPPSEAEKSLATTVKDKAEPLTSEVADAGKELAQGLKDQAVEAGRELKESTTEAAGQVADTAKGAAEDVRQQHGGSDASPPPPPTGLGTTAPPLDPAEGRL